MANGDQFNPPAPAHTFAESTQERPVLSPLRNRDARWVKPVITLKVKHLAFGCGLLRHATVRGVSRSLNMFDVLLIGAMEKSVGSTEPWHDICRKPMTYPPPDSHPLSTAERENTA